MTRGLTLGFAAVLTPTPSSREQLAADAHYSRGLAYLKKGEFDRAITDFDEAIRLNPEDGEAYHNRGVAHGKKGELARAEADFAKAKELGYANPE